MTRTRLGLLGLCAVVFGIMAFGATAAQATKWLVLNGSGVFVDAATLPASVTGAIENNKATLLTKILGALTHISCTAGTLVNVTLQGEGKVSEGGKVQFTGCSVVLEGKAAPECEVHSAGKPVGTVETLEGKGLAIKHNTEILTRLEPKTGETFVTLQMGEECPIGENVPIKGKLFVKDCVLNGATTEAVTHLIEEGPLSTLTALGNAATIDGSANISLTGAHAGRGWKADE
jgi:hypothetical protein